jgi:DNA-binding LacI/PurR family transcriptional regulator
MAAVAERAGGLSRQRRPGLRTVAQELSVSTMTVSNAYNRPDQLSGALREQILATAQRLGYPGPDPLARGLRKGRARALGMVHDTRLSYAVRDPALLSFLGGVGDSAEAEGLGLLLISGAAFEERNATAISEALVDGLIVYSVAEDDPLVAAALERRIPTVIVDQPRVVGVPFVGIDDRAAACEAASHLIELGHRRLAVISLPLQPDGHQGFADAARQNKACYRVHRSRLAGYRDAIEAAGIPLSQIRVFECPTSTGICGHDAGSALFGDKNPRPTAILAMSDQLALGAIDAAREHDIRVPDQLSIVGFDNIAAAETPSNQLTTINQDHSRKGQLAAEILLSHLRNAPHADAPLLGHQLVVRNTTSLIGV